MKKLSVVEMLKLRDLVKSVMVMGAGRGMSAAARVLAVWESLSDEEVVRLAWELTD